MKILKIKRKKSDAIIMLCSIFILFLLVSGITNISIVQKDNKNSKKVEIYCQEFFDKNEEKGYFKEKDLEKLKKYINVEYGFETNINANIIEDKEDMFLSVEIYHRNGDGDIIFSDKYYFEK